MKRIVLAYSGGVEMTAAIPWLSEQYGAEVVTVTLDLGESRELTDVRERALVAGAVRAHVLDVREEFVREYVLRAMQAGASLDGRTPLPDALACPLIAKRLVDMARMEGTPAVAFGGRADGNALRIDAAVKQLTPSLETIAPAQIWGFSRAEAIAYARAHSLHLPSHEIEAGATRNLWGRSIATAISDAGIPDDLFMLTRAPEDCPDEPALIEVDFDSGVPVRTNGLEMPLLEMIESLETIAGAHGVGRIESRRLTGTALQTVLEAPAAVVLTTAHSALQDLVLPRELERLVPPMSRALDDLIQDGLWFSPARDPIAAFVSAIQPRVTGTVTVRLFKGDCRVVSSQSPHRRDRVSPRRSVKRLQAGR
jgi:argininosuccinate synthase